MFRKENFDRSRKNFSAREKIVPAPVVSSANFVAPWVRLKYFTYNPNVYPRFVGETSGGIAPGTQVRVYGKDGALFGHGFYNAGANIPLRVFAHGAEDLPEDYFEKQLLQAVALRTEILKLPEKTDAFRVVHGDADGLNGLVVDKYGDVLSVEVFSLAVFQRIKKWIQILHAALGTTRETVQLVKGFGSMENARGCDDFHTPGLREVKIRENGIRYGVDFENGHKTGFFCDQRDNRAKLAPFCEGKKCSICAATRADFPCPQKCAGTPPKLPASISTKRQSRRQNATRISIRRA